MATELIVGPNDEVQGVKTFFGMDFLAPAVVVTTGTFMNGTIWVGRKSMPAGRAGEGASVVSTRRSKDKVSVSLSRDSGQSRVVF